MREIDLCNMFVESLYVILDEKYVDSYVHDAQNAYSHPVKYFLKVS